MKKLVLCVIALVSICACGGFGLAYEKHLAGDYYLIAVDTRQEMSVSYRDSNYRNIYCGVIYDGLYELGYNEHFILAKKYKEIKDSLDWSTHSYDKNITEYYIVPVDSVNARNKYWGPFTKEEFKRKRKEVGIPDSLQFYIRMKDLL